jgi:hypothetical protein
VDSDKETIAQFASDKSIKIKKTKVEHENKHFSKLSMTIFITLIIVNKCS